jgi:acyl-CoA thioester hydrolase
MIRAMPVPAPLEIFETEIIPEWIDPNGHLNMAYFMRVFDLATDTFQEYLDISWNYLEREAKSVFALEAHITYLDEVMLGEKVHIATRLMDYDSKRIHFFHEMYRDPGGSRAATNEGLLIHVDMASRRSEPWPARVMEQLVEIEASHAKLPRPAEAGARVGIRRKVA